MKQPTMNAVRLHRYGGVEGFRIDRVARPSPGPGDLLIRVRAAAVNPVDWKIRRGYHRALLRYRLPWILGLDVAGEVVERGERAHRFRPGDEVIASLDPRRPGSYAEFVVVDASLAAPKPRELDFESAAALPLAGLTAWQCLVGRVKPGDRVLIHAGSGGVGTLAIQIARHLGARVITTCSARNAELVRSLGADEVIDYRRVAFEEIATACHLVLDAIGGEVRRRSARCVRPGGEIVTISSDIPEAVERFGPYIGVVAAAVRGIGAALADRMRRKIRTRLVIQRSDGEQLTELVRLVDRGVLRPIVDRIYPLSRTAEAHLQSEAGRARGKIVLVP